MTIHKEGYSILIIAFLTLVVINIALFYLFPQKQWVFKSMATISCLILLFMLNFFRNPVRIIPLADKNTLYSPADGTVVLIEEVYDNEYFKDKRLQVSVFMSVWNVHLNRVPIDGTVSYAQYHPGKFLVAWLPKSSTDNEHSSVVIKMDNGQEVLLKQIAGAVARRISTYIKKDDDVKQGQELGFIRFGSRVDILLPLGTQPSVKIGDKVKGNLSVITKF
jgi:phosphatidylserine decarboxylase